MVFKREITRRDFFKLSAGSTAALGLLLFRLPNFEKVFAAAVAEVPVIWLQGSTCTGCSVSVLNSLSPRIQDVLVSQVVPGSHLSLRYHATVMAASGDLATKAMEDTAKKKGGYVLVIEGAIPTKDEGIYCEVGEKNGRGITMLEHVTTLGRDAMAVLALGTCAAYGGIPAAVPNPTGCKSVKEIFADNGIQTPVINLPGCPPHPDWFVGTVASILIGGLGSVEVDKVGRPLAFYEKLIHENCPRRGYFDAGKFAGKLSDPYCLFALGCKGPVTNADCPVRLWNSGTNWCVGCNGPCIGCVEPDFPDGLSPLYSMVSGVPMPVGVEVPTVSTTPQGISTPAAVGIGVGGAVVGAGIATGVAYALRKNERKSDHEQSEEGKK